MISLTNQNISAIQLDMTIVEYSAGLTDWDLWRNVVRQAKRDATFLARRRNKIKNKNLKDTKKACGFYATNLAGVERNISLLLNEINSDWFREICDMIDYDYPSVRNRIYSELNGFI